MIESIADDLAERALRKGKARLHELAGRIVLVVAGAAALLMAIGYGVHAAYLALAQDMSPIGAALIVGAVLLVLGAALIGVAMKGRNAVPEPKPAPLTPELEALYALRFVRGLLSGNGGAGKRASTLALLAAALAAGTLAGRRVK